VGIESTVVDMTGEVPVILRHGSITAEMLGFQAAQSHAAIKAPGMLESHYAPNTPLRLNAEHAGDGEVLIGFGHHDAAALNLSKTGDLTEAAANLFAMLRAADKLGARRIAVMPIPMAGLGVAINDRLTRAAAPR
jgi:L-threonylcarbamoyladenylate synthase